METKHVETWQRLQKTQQLKRLDMKWRRRAFRRITGYFPQADSFGHLYGVKK